MNGTSSTGRAAARAVGWLAAVSTAAYFLSDVLEASHGGFTSVQLWLTLACEATLPAVVLGLYQMQRPQIGRLGRYGAVAYAMAYLYFTYTVIYALAHGTPDFAALNQALNPAMTVFGAVMVAAGIAFGIATYHARVLPGWTGPTLAAGVVLVVATLALPAAVQLTAIGVRDLAFIGMGLAALGTGPGKRPEIPPHASPSPPSASWLPDGGNAGVGQAGAAAGPDGIDLYWLPLGAGGHWVRWNGKAYEALAAWHERRRRQDLYHSALEVRARGRRYVIEMAPAWNEAFPGRGVVCEGPVGARWLGRFRAFRYEVRCWEDGRIPDVLQAVDSPRRLDDDAATVVEVLQRTREVPALTWGRDELSAGEMWNSNSLVAWLLAGSGHDMAAITPPARGRAPGWAAGLQLARREHDGAGGPHVPVGANVTTAARSHRRHARAGNCGGSDARRNRSADMSRPATAVTRGGTVLIEAEADIRRPAEEVFDYASDPANEPEWNIRVKRAQKLTGGPVGVGARYRIAFTQSPPAISECVRFERPGFWEHAGRSKIISSGFSGRVVPHDDGSHLVLRMQIRPCGLLRFALPMVRRRMQRELARDVATVKTRLEGAAQASTSAPIRR